MNYNRKVYIYHTQFLFPCHQKRQADNVDEALFLNVLHNHMAVTQSDYGWGLGTQNCLKIKQQNCDSLHRSFLHWITIICISPIYKHSLWKSGPLWTTMIEKAEFNIYKHKKKKLHKKQGFTDNKESKFQLRCLYYITLETYAYLIVQIHYSIFSIFTVFQAFSIFSPCTQ